MADDDENPPDTFLYRGEGEIPRDEVRVEVHRSVEEIPDELFDGCDRLESVRLHEGLRRIADRAFRDCTSLRGFRCPSTVTEIGPGAFRGCSNLAGAVLPEGLVTIEDTTFFECESLERVRIPPTVARIGNYAFWGCTNLASVDVFEGLRKIGECAFDHCRSLGSIRVPLSVDEIGEGAFFDCRSLSSIRLHEDLPKMKRFAFTGCPPESIRFVPLLDRTNAVRMNIATLSMFENRLHEMALAITGEDHDNEDEDDSDEEEDVGDYWEKCKESLGRAHEFLTYLELKGATPVLELALWRAKINGEGVQGNRINNEDGGQDLSDAGGERKRPKVTKDIGQDARLSREDSRVKCGADIVFPEVLKFFTYSSSWPRLDDSGEGNVNL